MKNEGTVTRIKTDDNGVFEMLFIAIGASIRTFLNYLRPLLMIDAVHLKGLYKGTNLVAVAIDGNNQIVPMHLVYAKGKPVHVGHGGCPYSKNALPDAHEKLCRAGPQRWLRAHFPLVRYNYMTSNSVESVNACSVIYRKEPVLKLVETYRAMVQEWYYKRQQLAARIGAKSHGLVKGNGLVLFWWSVDWGKVTWSGQGEWFGTILVVCGARERAVGMRGILAGREVKGYCLGSYEV
nr:transposase, MuDR, MULE transposase domain protein [Tanacetum cinerariifolium]